MRTIRFAVVAAGILALLFTSAAWAQRGQGVMGSGGAGRMYNPQTVETLSGEVTSVDTMRRGRFPGVHLTVKTAKETIEVHLGPSPYLDKKGMKFSKGDKVEVTGSRVRMDGKPAIIAKQVKKDSQTLELRDDQGIPKWAGQGMRRRQR